jgi:DNA polymerase-3 subunit gamma/tau
LRRLADGSAASARAPALAPPPSSGPRGALAVAPAPGEVAPAPAAAPAARLRNFEEVVALARSKRDVVLTRALEHDMRIARFEPGRIEFTPTPTASPTLANALAKKLGEWTGERWMISVAPGATAPTLRETSEAREDQKREGAATHPVVRKVLEQFPGAKIVAIRAPEVAPPEAPPPTEPPDEEVGYADPLDFDDDI